MIISALDPQLHRNSCNMQEHFPNYGNKVFIIRRKIVTKKMTILQEYQINFNWNMPLVYHCKTFTHLISLWRTPSPCKSRLPNQFVPIYRDSYYTWLPYPLTILEIKVMKAPRFNHHYPKNRHRKRKRNPHFIILLVFISSSQSHMKATRSQELNSSMQHYFQCPILDNTNV